MSRLMSGIILLLFFFSPSLAYERIETHHFSILFQTDDRKIALGLQRNVESIRSRVMTDIGIDFVEKTGIIVAPTVEEFQHIQPDGAWVPLWAGAVAYPEKNLIIIRSPRSSKRGYIDYLEVFSHEFTHIALGRTIRDGKVPPWLAEGLAMYEAGEWNFERSASVVKAVLAGRLLPLRDLSFPADEGDAELAYAESFMFISFLINRMGGEAFHRFIRNYSRSGNLEASLKGATGMSMAEIEEKWLLYLKLRVSWIPMITSAMTVWLMVTFIFLYGYHRKRRLTTAKIKQWEEEEARTDENTATQSEVKQ